MKSEEYSAFIRGKIVAICEAMLKEEIGVIAGSRRLHRLGFEFCEVEDEELVQHDKDFLTFIAVDSETNHLPVDWERQNWSVEALARNDKEIAEAEALYQDDGFAACRKLIERFDMQGGI